MKVPFGIHCGFCSPREFSKESVSSSGLTEEGAAQGRIYGGNGRIWREEGGRLLNSQISL